ncbi:MAG: hypothetical protein RLZZ546_1599, partial [Bacteroidota bacterium]
MKYYNIQNVKMNLAVCQVIEPLTPISANIRFDAEEIGSSLDDIVFKIEKPHDKQANFYYLSDGVLV